MTAGSTRFLPVTARGLRPAGFTLLELMVVLVIAIGIVTLVAPRLGALMPGLEQKGAVRDIATALRFARGRAIATRQDTAVVFDLKNKTYRIQGVAREKVENIAKQLNIELVTGRSELLDESTGAISFFPDGSSTGGQVEIEARGRSFIIDVMWLTGKVSILDG